MLLIARLILRTWPYHRWLRNGPSTYFSPEFDFLLNDCPLARSNSSSSMNWVDSSAGEWAPCRQPEGALYFYHPDRVYYVTSLSLNLADTRPALQHIYTDVYMYDDTLRKEVETFANYLDQFLLSSQMTLPSNQCELVLELRSADNGKTEWFVLDFDAWENT